MPNKKGGRSRPLLKVVTAVNADKIRFRIGTRVRLKRCHQPKGPRAITTIRAFLPTVQGGAVLDDALDRSRCWNVEDLERV